MPPKQNIRWVLFDVGNVLIDFNHRRVSQGLLTYFPENRRTQSLPDELHSFIFENSEQISPNAQIDRGTKEVRWLRENVCRRFEISIPETEFAGIWLSVFADQLNAETMDCFRHLQQRGLEVAICSNTNREHWEVLLERHRALRELSERIKCFLSFNIRKIKTDHGFFCSVTDATMSPYEHHVLIDDREENCKAAESAGVYSVLFDPADHGGSVRRIIAFAKKHYLKDIGRP